MNATLLSRVIAVTLLAAAVASTAFAKRASDEIPPPYFSRVLCGMIGVAPLSLILIAVCVVAMLCFGSTTPAALRRFLLVSGALVVAGCFFAAMDSLNDEIWEPWLGASLFVAFVPTAALYLSLPRRSPWHLMAASVLSMPTWLVLVLVGIPWQVWAFNHGIPASW